MTPKMSMSMKNNIKGSSIRKICRLLRVDRLFESSSAIGSAVDTFAIADDPLCVESQDVLCDL